MSNFLKSTVLVIVMLVMCAASGSAQSSSEARLSKEKFTETQARHIASKLALDDKTTNKLVSTYCQQQKEIWALGPRLNRSNAATDAESESEIQQRFERSQKILNIREKYYKEYSKFLTQQQITQMYEIERQMMKRLANRSKTNASQNANRGTSRTGKRNTK